MSLIEKIQEKVGNNFGVAGFPKKYYNPKKFRPNHNPLLDEKEIVIPVFYMTSEAERNDQILENTIKKSILVHAFELAPLKRFRFTNYGSFLEEGIPTLFLFDLSKGIFTIPPSIKEKKQNNFGFFEDKPTFNEGYSLSDLVVKHSKYVFGLAPLDESCVDGSAKYAAKQNYSCIVKKLPPLPKELSNLETEAVDVNVLASWFSATSNTQEMFPGVIPYKYRFRGLSRDDMPKLLSNPSLLRGVLNRAREVWAVYNFYEKVFYEKCYDTILEKVKKAYGC